HTVKGAFFGQIHRRLCAIWHAIFESVTWVAGAWSLRKPRSPAIRGFRRLQPRPPGSLLLHTLVPVDSNIVRLSAPGDDVDAAIAVEVRRGEVFHGDAAVVEDVPCPFRALVVERLVQPHAAPLAGFVAFVVADADDDFVILVAVEVGAPDGVA